MAKVIALTTVIALTIAACRTAPAPDPSLPPPTPDASIALPTATIEAVTDPPEILRRTREAMSGLSSFEAHTIWLKQDPAYGDAATDWLYSQTDYRYEPPDRHSILSVNPLEGAGRTGGQPFSESHGESRRIGRHYWTRDALRQENEWTCSDYDIEGPRTTGYVPSDKARYVGLEDSSFGAQHHFRFESADASTDHWIDARSWRVMRTNSVRFHDGITEWETRRLTAFNSPRQIFEPGPCVMEGELAVFTQP